jgi:hypothetical protein
MLGAVRTVILCTGVIQNATNDLLNAFDALLIEFRGGIREGGVIALLIQIF